MGNLVRKSGDRRRRRKCVLWQSFTGPCLAGITPCGGSEDMGGESAWRSMATLRWNVAVFLGFLLSAKLRQLPKTLLWQEDMVYSQERGRYFRVEFLLSAKLRQLPKTLSRQTF